MQFKTNIGYARISKHVIIIGDLKDGKELKYRLSSPHLLNWKHTWKLKLPEKLNLTKRD